MENKNVFISFKKKIMSEIIVHNNENRKHRKKKLASNVDLTPMVDLGFLLITFFIITTTMSSKHALNVHLPADGSATITAESKTLTIILKGKNQVDYYNGKDLAHIATIGFENAGVRKMIVQKKQRLLKILGTDTGITIIIKPTAASNYANVVNALNEMPINGIKKFILTDISAEEKKTNILYQ